MVAPDPFAVVARRVVPDGKLERSWVLHGGVSAEMRGLEVVGRDGRRHRLVVRRPGQLDWKGNARNVAATEYALLHALRGAGLTVPEPRFVDESGDLLPSPYYVTDFVDGTTAVEPAVLPDALSQMAAFLAELHELDRRKLALPPLPAIEDPAASVAPYLPPGSLGEALGAAIARRPQVGPNNPPCLLHGDFWPGNVLWRDGRLAAVVDWEDAAFGDPLADLACARVELTCQYDDAAMARFTSEYLARRDVDCSDLLLWEVYVSAAAAATLHEWGLAPDEEAHRLRRTRAFLERAGQELLDAS